MALRDLVVSTEDLTEAQIEELIQDYLRYDLNAKELVLLPPASKLGNRQRILVYLVGLLGWPIVLPDDPPATAMKPSELETALNIPGGSLRPILKTLKEERLVQVDDGKYSVNRVTFPFLKEELARPQSTDSAAEISKQQKKRKNKKSASDETQLDLAQGGEEQSGPSGKEDGNSTKEGGQAKSRTRRDATVAGAGPLERVRRLISEGWFSEPRSVRDVVNELASRGATYKGQDLTRQMLTLVRSDELTREKKPKGGTGREVWHYSQP